MMCPHCQNPKTEVKDSRPAEIDKRFVRRRRLCPKCGARFGTTEVPLAPTDLDRRFQALAELTADITAKEWRQLRITMRKLANQNRSGAAL